MPRPVTRWRLRAYLGMLLVSTLVGGAYSALNVLETRRPLVALLVGALHGFVFGATIGAAEMFGVRTRPGRTIERAPFLVTVGVKTVLYGALIVTVLFGDLGHRLLGVLPPAPGAGTIRSVVFSFAITVAFIFVFQMGQIVGGRNLRDLVLGRYHSPRVEERFFLFVDVRGSTGIAEQLGPAGVHRFLHRVFGLASGPVDDHRGEIHQYVGDEMVVTWSVATGRVEARPLACFFEIERGLDEAAPEFTSEFGVTARVRAALHAGQVIAGEVGDSKREIVFHGDVMNTTSRLEQMAGELDRRVLVSEDAVRRLQGMERYVLEDVGMCRLRGRQNTIQVYAVEPERVAVSHASSAKGVARE